MKKIAITGNIASGKSQVEKILENMGYKVIDTDKINHQILENDKTSKDNIFRAFSEFDIKDNSGNISREKLGEIVFNSNEKMKILEGILHERIFNKLDELFKEYEKEEYVFVSVPLLFETGKEKIFDKIIYISADEKIRLERLINRNNYSKDYAKIRIDSQEKDSEKIKKSDYIIYNNSDLISLKNQVLSAIKEI